MTGGIRHPCHIMLKQRYADCLSNIENTCMVRQQAVTLRQRDGIKRVTDGETYYIIRRIAHDAISYADSNIDYTAMHMPDYDIKPMETILHPGFFSNHVS